MKISEGCHSNENDQRKSAIPIVLEDDDGRRNELCDLSNHALHEISPDRDDV